MKYDFVFAVAWVSTCIAVPAPQAGAQTVLYELLGKPSPLDLFGNDVCGVADVDFDGRVDILVGAPQRYNAAGLQTGAAIVISGRTGLVLRTHFGILDGERIGSSVLATGDLDADGVGDYAVGAGEADYGASQAGAVFYYSGASGALIRRVDGAYADSMIGSTLASLGDVNGDGVPDLAAGGAGAPANPARVQVISGANGATLYILQEPVSPPTTLRVAGIGDTNGDGIGDLAIGSSAANSYAGSVRIVSGSNGALLRQLVSPGGEFGSCASATGDVDGDGFGDVMVSAPWEGSTGRVSVFSGASGSILRTFDGEGYGEHFGRRAVRCADFDGDGVGEYAISATFADHTGTDAGRVRVFSGQSGAVLYWFDGDDSGANLGSSLASLGDVNGDGIGDLAAGQPNTQPASVKVYSGTSLTPAGTNFCAALPNSAGPGAIICYAGSASIAAGNFSLTVSGCPPNKPGVFIFAFQEALIPFGNGLLCIKGQSVRRIAPPVLTSPVGTASLPLDFAHTPTNFLPGANPKFQIWYRDPAAGGAGFNISNGLSMTFCP